MTSFALLQPITNVLLFDTEAQSVIESVVESSHHVRDYLMENYRENSFESIELKFKVVLAIPSERSDLREYCREIEQKMKALGVSLSSSIVKPEDMSVVSGKAGLLANSLWQVAGALIFNDAL